MMMMIIIIKKKFDECNYKKWTQQNINIKNRTYYFYNIIDIENIDSKLLKIDKKSYKDINIFDIGYVTKKKINNILPSYLCFILA